MKKSFKLIFVGLGLAMIIGACTNLDEKLYDTLDAQHFYKTPDELSAALAGVYNSLNNGAHYWWQTMEAQELTTDHGIVPWNDGGVHYNAHAHTWNSNWSVLSDLYGGEFSAIATANSFLSVLALSYPQGGTLYDQNSSEVRCLRALCYMELMDYFGGVPIVLVDRLDPLNLPARNTRLEVFNFVEKELLDAIAKLPSVKTLPFPRVGKETAQGMLAKLYLNAEVWSGTARWADCSTQCDAVIASGAYTLPGGYGEIWNAFKYDNHTTGNNKEIIFAVSKDNPTGNGLFTGLMSFPGGMTGAVDADGKDLGFTNAQQGWNGPSATIAAYNIYDPQDFRRTLILKGKYYNAKGTLLKNVKPFANTDYVNWPNGNDTVQYGLSCIKYAPDPSSSNGWMNNDLVLMRFSDILLSKAEAMYRISAGNKGEAEALITQVYARNFKTAKTFTINSLDDILAERSREFLWEGTYRTDLIRFGKFDTWRDLWRTAGNIDPDHLKIFPIPTGELQANPNLKQNPGY